MRSKLNNSIQMAKNPQDSDKIQPLQLSLEADTQLEETGNLHSPNKAKCPSKYSNFTNISTADTFNSFICLSRDALTP